MVVGWPRTLCSTQRAATRRRGIFTKENQREPYGILPPGEPKAVISDCISIFQKTKIRPFRRQGEVRSANCGKSIRAGLSESNSRSSHFDSESPFSDSGVYHFH